VAEKFSVDLTIVQGEVIVRALELCGANDGLAKAIEHFNDPHLAVNAKPARHVVHAALVKASQRHTVGIDATRAAGQLDEVGRLRKANDDLQQQLRRMTEDHAIVQRTLRNVGQLLVNEKGAEAIEVLEESYLVPELFDSPRTDDKARSVG
jgi:hypothetical protein